jgi:hypothetical protein
VSEPLGVRQLGIYNNNCRGCTVRHALQGEAFSMKRKPDVLWVLVILFSLGVVTTGYTQSLWDRQPEAPVSQTQAAG